jgi:hypothetical protein
MVDLTAAAAAAARFVMTDFQIQLIDYDPFFLIFHSHSLLIFFYIFNLGFGISGSSFIWTVKSDTLDFIIIVIIINN